MAYHSLDILTSTEMQDQFPLQNNLFSKLKYFHLANEQIQPNEVENYAVTQLPYSNIVQNLLVLLFRNYYILKIEKYFYYQKGNMLYKERNSPVAQSLYSNMNLIRGFMPQKLLFSKLRIALYIQINILISGVEIIYDIVSILWHKIKYRFGSYHRMCYFQKRKLLYLSKTV